MPQTPRKHHLAELDMRRHGTTRAWLADLQTDQARRLRETRKLFGAPVVLADLHTHSEHSDGRATIAMNRDAGIAAGLDFVFATDHRSLKQKRAIRKMPTMSWGQEPGALHHHIGLLCNRRLFVPRKDRLDLDVERARRLAPFVWIPHPAGWYPRKYYTEEQTAALWTLAPGFAMEVLNGAHRIGTAFDQFDEAAVAVWDRLLADGIRVTPLGASDAHIPESIGCCWTAMPEIKPGIPAVLDALNTGNCLASEGPLLTIRLNDRPMGSTVKKTGRGRRMRLTYRAVDAAGLQCVRIVAGGRVRKTLTPHDATCIEGDWSFNPASFRYIRLEARAVDNRRAFSGPIYIA